MFRENALFLCRIYFNTMTKKQYFFYTAIFLICVSNMGFSQNFIGKTSYEFIGDNREYFNSYGFPQTILGSRASQELGFSLDSCQKIMFGGSYFITHGANQFEQKPILTTYYKYYKKREIVYYYFQIGSIPRDYNIFPKSIYSDSMMYVRPNIQGISAKIFNLETNDFSIYGNGIFDWLQQKNYGEQESFLAGYNGSINYKHFNITNYYYYRHFASDNISGYKDVQDNGALGITFGYKTAKIITDSITLRSKTLIGECNIGKLITWVGNRPNPIKYAGGLIFNAYLNYDRFGIFGVYYYGDGTLSPLGDPLYRCGNYGRVDAKYIFIEKNGVTAFFSFNTHFIDSDINFSQNISVKANIDYKIWKVNSTATSNF